MAKYGFYHKENGLLYHTWVEERSARVMQQIHGRPAITLSHPDNVRRAREIVDQNAERVRRLEMHVWKRPKTSIVWFGHRAND